MHIYEYFEQRGFWRMIISRITSLLILAFTVVFSTFLLLFVNWNEILNCHSQQNCSQITVIRRPELNSLSVSEVAVVAYFIVFSLYWVWNLFGFLHCLRDGIEMRSFYRSKLEISDEALQTMEWPELVYRIQRLQKEFKISLVKDHDALDISNRILRKDNYFIAMVNSGVIDLGIPFLSSKLHVSPILGKSLEWNIRFCVLDSMFHDELFTVREAFLQKPQVLRRLFVYMAIANFLLMPFILLFMIIFFFLKNAEELHSRKAYLGPRQWSPLAEWTFREFNEMPHAFRTRLNESHCDALAYISQFPPPAFAIFVKFVAYVSGAIVGVLLLLTIKDSSILVDIHVFDHSLLYYLFSCTAILALCRSLGSSPSSNQDFGTLIANIYRHTHYQPRSWREEPQSSRVRSHFAKLYPFKVVLFLQEVLCVLVTPLVLGITLPAVASRLIEFIRQHTIRQNGVGDICVFASYDFSIYRHRNHRFGEADTCREKMERSLLSFSMMHPRWRPNEEATAILMGLSSESGCAGHRDPSVSIDDDNGELSRSTMALAIDVADIDFSRTNDR
uniref:Autophagy-related protein 9 n=1 Tax=Spongospora subterranea TaxID=70186 RepID=A0A0H5QNY5_9EUKA|eukprot:CRZ03106.1 hypothetical protein [Spongospora subterranea]